MLKKTTIIAAALALLAGPVLASSDDRADSERRYTMASDDVRCTARPAGEWLTIDQLTQKLKDQGYTVSKVERSHGCYEVKGTDAKNLRVEIYVDPTTGEIVKRDGRS